MTKVLVEVSQNGVSGELGFSTVRTSSDNVGFATSSLSLTFSLLPISLFLLGLELGKSFLLSFSLPLGIGDALLLGLLLLSEPFSLGLLPSKLLGLSCLTELLDSFPLPSDLLTKFSESLQVLVRFLLELLGVALDEAIGLHHAEELVNHAVVVSCSVVHDGVKSVDKLHVCYLPCHVTSSHFLL